MKSHLRYAVALALSLMVTGAAAEIETVSGQAIGMDTQLVYEHALEPGANAIRFSYASGFAPLYGPEESHTVVIVFEWGPTALGPWESSPDYVNTVPGGETDLFATGIFTSPADARFVALHFYAGALMITSGTFEHIAAVVPLPASGVLLGVTCFTFLWRNGARSRQRHLAAL